MKKTLCLATALAITALLSAQHGAFAAPTMADTSAIPCNEYEIEEEPSAEAELSASLVASGTCGDNLTWTLEEDGTFTISGTGEMSDYHSYSDGSTTSSWCEYSSSIKEVVINSGVTSIGDCSFYKCENLESITIPDGVICIGMSAFSQCIGLTSVTIPEGVTILYDGAFFGCKNLTSITIPDSVTDMGVDNFHLFNGCDKLTIYSYTNSAAEAYATHYEIPFVSIGVSEINVGSGTCRDNLIWTLDKDGVLTVSGSGNMNDYHGYVPWSKYSLNIKKVILSDGITSICNYAFQDCGNLESITIPNSVTSIGEWAFADCASLKSITIPNGVTSIGWYTFYHCNSLTSVIIPNGVTSIADRAFDCCYSLKTITLSGSVTSMGEDMFALCNSLTSINVDENNETYCSIDGNLFSKDKSTLVKYAPGKKDTKYTIPKEVTSVGDYAFSYCKNLKSITMPTGVTSIGNYAFASCNDVTSIKIPDSVTSIGEYAFEACWELSSITIPSSVASIGTGAFVECFISNIDVDKNNKNYCSIDGNLFSKDKSTLIKLANCSEKYVIPDGVTSIGDYACNNLGSKLTSITIPDSVISIGNDALSDNFFSSITIPDNVTSIGYRAFSGCINLTSVTIPDGVTSIGRSAFSGCDSLTSIKIPDSVTSISSYAFEGCDSLTSIKIPDSVTSIESSAFSSCYRLTSIKIPDSVTSIGQRAFSSCYKLKKVIIPASVTRMEWDIFSGCDNLTIYGYTDSTAEKYAKEHNIPFVAIDNMSFSGDLSGDGEVTSEDAIYLLYHTFWPEEYPIDVECDYNGDGEINSEDAIYLLFYTFWPDEYPLFG